jgi:putative endonuclease
MAEHNEIGKIGENIATTFLMKQGFSILERNYATRLGELDIVAKKDEVLHFIEVKSIKVRDFENLDTLPIKPEDNLTLRKWSKLRITIEQYCLHKNVSDETPRQIDLTCVYINTEKRQGRVSYLENVHKEE